MEPGKDRWNAGDAADWGRVLGLVPVPLFGQNQAIYYQSGNVLLDGQRSSFSFLVTDDSRELLDNRPLEWSWSSFLNHTIIADTKKDLLLLRRWDSPETIRRFQLPASPRGASQLFDIVRGGKPVAHTDVILYLLKAFRSIRGAIRGRDNGLEALRLFNALILASKAVVDDRLSAADVSGQADIGGVLRRLESLPESYAALLRAGGAHELEDSTRALASQTLVARFIDVETRFRYSLEPNLLMRHASGQLYQEAHLALERQPDQPSLFPGMDEAETAANPAARSDVRFTPVALARTLVQQALDAFGDLTYVAKLDILDPACGSAVFLIQAVLEIVNRGYRGKLVVRGFDLSAISCTMARFCLEHACQDARANGIEVTYVVEATDALACEWGHPHIVLMNPPFIHVDRMEGDELEIVKRVLGQLDKGRSDKAMAFAWKAFQSIRPGGVVSTVLPAPLLETTAGDRWREVLAKESQMALLGCFRGYGYFKGTKVEPAFLVLKKPTSPPPPPHTVTVVVASDGEEDNSLRALRQAPEFVSEGKNYEVFRASSEDILPQPTWTPRSKNYRVAMEVLKDLDIPTVGDLFSVQQGALTGLNVALIIPAEVLKKYKASSQRYFRPVAATSSIRNGKLTPKQFVFYPYDASGLLLTTEEQVEKAVPAFYKEFLLPHREKLIDRASIPPETWWRLTREREWQREPSPKLVSAYFGQRGNFAFDDAGQFVVTQGYAWHWQEETSEAVEIEDPAVIDRDTAPPVSFYQGPLPWAYLALMNSGVFERFLSFVCPTMQGGQLNLSVRYVTKVYIPNLAGNTPSTKDMVRGLARTGRAIYLGEDYDLAHLNHLAARAYRMPLRDILPNDA